MYTKNLCFHNTIYNLYLHNYNLQPCDFMNVIINPVSKQM